MRSSTTSRPSSPDVAVNSLVPGTPGGPVGPIVPKGAQYSTLAFTRIVSSDPEAAKQKHLSLLGDMDAIWADYTGKGVSIGIYDSGVQRSHWDLDGNYDATRHVVVDGKTYDGDWDPQSENMGRGTSIAGVIAAERNGRGGMGVSYDAKITGVNIYNPFSEDGAKPGIYIGSDDLTKFIAAFDQATNFDIVTRTGAGSGYYLTETSRTVEGTIYHALATSLAKAAATGRDGLGTITVTAANEGSTLFFGAGHEQSDSWTTDRHTVAVGAYRGDNGSATFASFGGPHLLVSAPAGDISVLSNPDQIVTTDLTSYWGYNTKARPGGKEDYTDAFDSNAAAAAVVSGTVALMLDANDALGWRDVSAILAASAKMPVAFDTKQTIVDGTALKDKFIRFEAGGRYTLNNSTFGLVGTAAGWNGGRMHYSTDYGYGAVDAYSAVRMAEVWGLFSAPKTSANEALVDTGMIVTDIAVPKASSERDQDYDVVANDFMGAVQPAVTFNLGALDVEHVDLTLVVRGSGPNGDLDPVTGEWTSTIVPMSFPGLRFKVTAPDGTSAFMDTYGGLPEQVEGAQQFTFGLAAFRGVEAAGTWKVEFENLVGGEIDTELTLEGVRLQAFGHEQSNDDVYTYTNEFFTMAAIRGEGGRKVLNDTDGGTDWINAAAVSSDVKLSLVGGQSTSFGGEKAFTIGRSSVIEGAVTGDGNDVLTGSRFDNALFAMRGDDVLNGGAGNDTLFGGRGMDKFLFDNRGASGKDTILDWSRGDMIATQTALRGQGGDGTVTVAKSAMLLLDGQLTGDTVTLSQNGGAVLKAQGQKDGYFWYSYQSGADLDPNEVIREVSFQPERTAAGEVAASAVATSYADAGAAFASAGDIDAGFYLYDAMAGSMSGGVLLAA